jgi:hypothetical protein
MRQVIYTMHFRGQASRSGDAATALRTTAIGTSCTINTVVGPGGVQTDLHAAPGDLAFLESQVQITPPDSFEGRGTLMFGDETEHVLRFSTIKAGHFGPSAMPGVMAGTVSWRIDGGGGQFASATGFITSTFTLSDSGELSEYHCGLIFLPD